MKLFLLVIAEYDDHIGFGFFDSFSQLANGLLACIVPFLHYFLRKLLVDIGLGLLQQPLVIHTGIAFVLFLEYGPHAGTNTQLGAMGGS